MYANNCSKIFTIILYRRYTYSLIDNKPKTLMCHSDTITMKIFLLVSIINFSHPGDICRIYVVICVFRHHCAIWLSSLNYVFSWEKNLRYFVSIIVLTWCERTMTCFIYILDSSFSSSFIFSSSKFDSS